jgi:hypothetical protein
MKKFVLLLVSLVVLLSLLSACNDNSVSTGGGEGGGGEGGGGGGGMLASMGSSLAINNAMINFGNELSVRVSSTPFVAFEMLAESLTQGTTNIGFTHSGERMDWRGNTSRTNVGGNFAFIADERNLDYALIGDVNVEGVEVDFSAYFNMERMAFGSSLIGGTYGLRYASLRSDVQRLFDEFGLAAFGIHMDEVNEIIDAFEAYMEVINDSVAMNYEGEEYIRVFMEFLQNSEAEAEDVTVNDESARRVAYNFTASALTGLLRDWITTFENDEMMIGMYGNPLMTEANGIGHGEIVRELRNAVRELDSVFNGDFSVAFYIGERDRLLRMNISGSVDVYGDSASFGVMFDFGESATDTWRVTVSYDDGWNAASIGAQWEIRNEGGRVIHEISMRDPNTGAISLISNWNPTNGDFFFAYEMFGMTEELLRGNFLVDGRLFTLRLDIDIDSWSGSSNTVIEIATERGHNIGNISFISIGDITMEMVEEIVANVMGGMGMGMGGFPMDW